MYSTYYSILQDVFKPHHLDVEEAKLSDILESEYFD